MSTSLSAYQSAIYGQPAKRPSKGLMLGIAVALGLHALFAAYLINQQFLVPTQKSTLPYVEPTDVTLYTPPKEQPDTPKPVATVVPVHAPTLTTPSPVDTLPVPPQTEGTASSATTVALVPITQTPTGGATVTEPRYVKGAWTFPTGTDMAGLYPPRALDNEVEGSVTIDCAINGSGRIKACDIISETPKGYGFGKATVTAFLKYAAVKPSSVDGQLRDGDRRRFTYVWTLD
jgi:protein TonB